MATKKELEEGAVVNIGKEINSTRQSNGISPKVSTQLWVIIAPVIIVQPGLLVVVLAR